MAQKIVSIILVLMVIGGLAWYINKTYFQPSKSQASLSNIPKYNNTNTSSESDQPKLIFLTNGDAKTIWEVGADKQSKKLFTDLDETDKIIKVSNLASSSNEVLAIVSNNPESRTGKLVVIDLNSQDDKLLQSSFLVPEEWSVSSDGKKIIYVRFSNVEENYGYTLYSQERDGSNTRELINNQSAIKKPVTNTAGTKIAYITTDENKVYLNVFDTEAGKAEVIKDFDNVSVDWLSFKDEKIILSIRDINTTDAGMIEILNQNGNDLQKITDYEGGIANFVYMHNSSFVSYVVAQYDDVPNEETTGQIYIYNLNNEKKDPIQKGVQVLGWKVDG